MTDDTDTTTASLKAHSLFALLDTSGRKRLLEQAVMETYRRGHKLLKEGDEGGAFYVIVKGQASVIIENLGGPREVAQLERGAIVGEKSALLGEPRSATVAAVTPLNVLRFDSPNVMEIIEEYPAAKHALVKLGLQRAESNLQLMSDD